MNSIAKKQHYIPQCLIKHFANKGKISVFDSKRNMVRHGRSIREEFAQNYFYGADNKVESFLSSNIEKPAAELISSLVAGNIVDQCIPSKELLRFVSVQLMRTPGALTEALDAIDKFTGTIIRKLGELNDFPSSAVEGIKVVPTDPRLILSKQVLMGALNWEMIADLGQHLLINETSIPFVISDHPVVRYNWYFKDSSDPDQTALVTAGIQIFLPLSPTVTLCLFDKKIYKMGNGKTARTTLQNERDISILNRLQVLNREEIIVFRDQENESYVRDLCSNNGPMELHSTLSEASALTTINAQEFVTTHTVWRVQKPISYWLSVVKIRRSAKRYNGNCYQRRPEFVEKHRKL